MTARIRIVLPALLAATTAVVTSQSPGRTPATTPPAPTFYADVQPILRTHCESCHGPHAASHGGMVAPMPLTTYEEARRWARAITTAVESRQMPPWLASPATRGVFINERGLTPAQIATLGQWARGGTPAGQPPARALPSLPATHAEGWTLGEPNLDVRGEPQTLTDDSREDMVTFEVGEMPDDLWIRGVEFLGGSPAVHHMCGALVLPARTYVATNAQIAPSLGRNVSACAPTGACNGTLNVAAIPNGQRFDERLNQIDTRFTRSFTVAKSRIQGIFEIYNLTNTRPSQANQTTFNANWLQPSVLLGGRLFKFGAQVDF